jgi:hypothetical protein
MDKRIEKLEELNDLLNSGAISKNEYRTLAEENLGTKEIENEKNLNFIDHDEIKILRLKNAGKNVLGIFYCIVFEIILLPTYNFLVGFKVGYDNATGNANNIEGFSKYLENLEIGFYISQLALSFFIIHFLWCLGVNLKNVDRKPE